MDKHEAPQWMGGNSHVHTGYRVNHNFWELIQSIFRPHNDLMNIWTHFFGMILFLALLYFIIFNRDQNK